MVVGDGGGEAVALDAGDSWSWSTYLRSPPWCPGHGSPPAHPRPHQGSCTQSGGPGVQGGEMGGAAVERVGGGRGHRKRRTVSHKTLWGCYSCCYASGSGGHNGRRQTWSQHTGTGEGKGEGRGGGGGFRRSPPLSPLQRQSVHRLSSNPFFVLWSVRCRQKGWLT
jgi:hypothetical protein